MFGLMFCTFFCTFEVLEEEFGSTLPRSTNSHSSNTDEFFKTWLIITLTTQIKLIKRENNRDLNHLIMISSIFLFLKNEAFATGPFYPVQDV